MYNELEQPTAIHISFPSFLPQIWKSPCIYRYISLLTRSLAVSDSPFGRMNPIRWQSAAQQRKCLFLEAEEEREEGANAKTKGEMDFRKRFVLRADDDDDDETGN